MATATLRSCTLSRDENNLLILSIIQQIGRRTTKDHYRLERKPAGPQCWRLHKATHEGEEPQLYDVELNGEQSQCCCLGFSAHNHCKHIESLTALLEAGRLEEGNEG